MNFDNKSHFNINDPKATVCVYGGRPAGEIYDRMATVVKPERVKGQLSVYNALIKKWGLWDNWLNGPNYKEFSSNAEAQEFMRYRLGQTNA